MIDIVGTRLQGLITTSYSKLVETFGEPNMEGDGYKTQALWAFITPAGDVVTIYDYKQGSCYLGDDDGVAWEFVVEQYDNLGCGPMLQVQMSDGSWDAFVQVPEFFAALQAKRPRRLAELRELLDCLGAVDITRRTDPNSFDRPLRDRSLLPHVHNIAGEHRGDNPEQDPL